MLICFVRCLGNLGLRVLIQVYFGVLHSQGFKVWAGNWLFLVPVWVLRPQSYQEASSLRGLVVGGERQLKAELSCEVTIEQLEYGGNSDFKIEHTELIGGLFSSVWGQGGPGIRGGIIWSFRASKVPVELQESWDSYHVYIDVFDVLDVVRCTCGLFVWGPGKQHQPRGPATPSEASTAGRGGPETR